MNQDLRRDAAWWFALRALLDAAAIDDLDAGLGAREHDGVVIVSARSRSRGAIDIGQVTITDLEATAAALTADELAAYFEARDGFSMPLVLEAARRRHKPAKAIHDKLVDNQTWARSLEQAGKSRRAIAREALQTGRYKSSKVEEPADQLENARRSVNRWLDPEK